MSQKFVLELSPFLYDFFKDTKPSKKVQKFIRDKFLDVALTLCSETGKYANIDFSDFIQAPACRVESWDDSERIVTLVEYTMLELINCPSFTPNEKILSLLARVPSYIRTQLLNRLEEYMTQELFGG